MAGLAFKVIGTIGIASYAAAYLCAKLRHVSYFRFKVVAVQRDRLPAMPRGYNWRALGPADLAEHRIDVGPEEQRARFAQGLECLGIFDRRDGLVGLTWIGKRSHRDHQYGLHYLLPPVAAWDTGLWVAEEKRMTRAFAAVWAAVGEWLSREGLHCTMSSIADYNVESITSHRRLGARELHSVVVLRVGAVQLTFGARPLLHVRTRADVPVLDLNVPAAAN